MNITFHIEYYTATGEQLAINLVGMHGEQRHLMSTDDNAHWYFTWVADGYDAPTIDFYYSVETAHGRFRSEWTTIRHRLDLPTRPLPTMNVYCRWIDMPHDTYRYSSAFTQCLHPHVVEPLRSPGDRCLRVVCRAPQLRSGHRLVLTGSDRALGDWNPERGIPMIEHGYHEWVAEIATDLLTSQHVEFKFVLMSNKQNAPIWEDGKNRTMDILPADGLVVRELDQSFYPLCDERVAGTLIPVFSLRTEGSFGVGDFGDLMAMTNFVASTGQRVLQILPINDTTVNHTWTDSYPYSCISVFALHPQYADLRRLPTLSNPERQHHYEQIRQELNQLQQIDYERMMEAKTAYLRELYEQVGQEWLQSEAFATFFEENQQWLVPYAQYCNLRDAYRTTDFARWHGHDHWNEADRSVLSTPGSTVYHQVAFYYFCQYILDSQMAEAHRHARQRGVVLKGDIPIGVHREGCDVWMEPRFFCLDGQAGAPPDDFATDGQNWGFPTYNWAEMKADGYRWWNRRFTHMARYFDAYRIDHVLGFFRIWEIPINAVRGLLGQFAPALGYSRTQLDAAGLHLEDWMLAPYITDEVLSHIFGKHAEYVKRYCLDAHADGTYSLRPCYATERQIQAMADKGCCPTHLLRGLMDLACNVLWLADHRQTDCYHPRIDAHHTRAYRHLSDAQRRCFDRLYDDFFYHRNNGFWYGEALCKLEPLIQATHMLTCAEDLGMVPACVAPVMDQLRILSLEIQTMPKTATRFADLAHNPYRSVSTFSSHDMAPLRQWWDEDYGRAQDYYSSMLHLDGEAPHPMPGWLAENIVQRHLDCPSMLCILSLQDWLALNDRLRLPDPNSERINIPANPHHYWRYRMHINIEQLSADDHFGSHLREMIAQSGRLMK